MQDAHLAQERTAQERRAGRRADDSAQEQDAQGQPELLLPFLSASVSQPLINPLAAQVDRLNGSLAIGNHIADKPLDRASRLHG